MLSCSLTKGITPKICRLCFFRINNVLLNRLCVWILFENASSHSCFRFFPHISVRRNCNNALSSQTFSHTSKPEQPNGANTFSSKCSQDLDSSWSWRWHIHVTMLAAISTTLRRASPCYMPLCDPWRYRLEFKAWHWCWLEFKAWHWRWRSWCWGWCWQRAVVAFLRRYLWHQTGKSLRVEYEWSAANCGGQVGI